MGELMLVGKEDWGSDIVVREVWGVGLRKTGGGVVGSAMLSVGCEVVCSSVCSQRYASSSTGTGNDNSKQ